MGTVLTALVPVMFVVQSFFAVMVEYIVGNFWGVLMYSAELGKNLVSPTPRLSMRVQ
jgi:hypothetical protein